METEEGHTAVQTYQECPLLSVAKLGFLTLLIEQDT